jgi:hypothetical protein
VNVQLLYRVPVALVVDTATVARVVVLDEEVAPEETADVCDHDRSRPLPADYPLAQRARTVAEDADWPAWEAGW